MLNMNFDDNLSETLSEVSDNDNLNETFSEVSNPNELSELSDDDTDDNEVFPYVTRDGVHNFIRFSSEEDAFKMVHKVWSIQKNPVFTLYYRSDGNDYTAALLYLLFITSEGKMFLFSLRKVPDFDMFRELGGRKLENYRYYADGFELHQYVNDLIVDYNLFNVIILPATFEMD